MDFSDMIKTHMLLSLQQFTNKSIAGILFTVLTFIAMSYSEQIRQFCEDTMLLSDKVASVELVGTIIEERFSSRRCFSKRFLSVLHYIKTMTYTAKGYDVKSYIEICFNVMDEIARSTSSEMLVNQEKPIALNEDIYCKFKIATDDNFNEKTKVKHSSFSIKLFSKTKTAVEIQDFLDKCVCQLNEYTNDILNSKLYNFVYEHDQDMHFFKKLTFQSNKNFDNVFFAEKAELIRRVEFFESRPDQYKKFGIPHTFGILMHGAPGTGKTSTIKAMANYTKRHIISIPLHKIKDISTLTKVFLNPEIDGVIVPFNKRIYVFEEIDCNGLKDILQPRCNFTGTISSKMSTSDACDLVEVIKDEILYERSDNVIEQLKQLIHKVGPSSSLAHIKEDTNKVTLGGLLELLDGIVETPGRIIVFTTNHPEHLDEALTRPGRIDMNIKFKKATVTDMVEMFKLWFDVELDNEDVCKLSSGRWTHAEICQMFFNSLDHPYHVLKLLQANK